MKKIFMGSAVLTAFSLSIIAFQMSCQKTATAQTNGNTYVLPPATTSTLGGVIPDGTTISVDATGKISAKGVQQLNEMLYLKYNSNTQATEIWLANIDGTNQRKVPINLPSNLVISEEARLTADGKTIIFRVYDNPEASTNYIYSCNIDGSNVKKIVDGTKNSGIFYEGISVY